MEKEEKFMTNTIVITGKTIAELEEGLAQVKKLMGMGVKCAVGGSSIADVEKGLEMVGVKAPTETHCCCNNCCCDECEDDDLYDEYEDEDYLYEEYEEEEAEEDVREIINELCEKLEDVKGRLRM